MYNGRANRPHHLLDTLCFEDGFGSHLLVLDSDRKVVARAHTYKNWLDLIGLTDFFQRFPEAEVNMTIMQGDLNWLIANSDFS